MYASVRKYLVDAARIDDLMQRVEATFAPRVEEMPGFVAYQVINAGEDRVGKDIVISVTVCSDREAVDRSVEMAAEFVSSELSDIEIERVEAAEGEVGVSRGTR
jgi:glycerol-3-phosphate responsive antiterminator